MATQTRNLIIGAIFLCLLSLAIGILIGHFAIDKSGDDGNASGQTGSQCGATRYSTKWYDYKNKYLQTCESRSCLAADCNEEDLPRTYLAYHLGSSTINIDGRLDDPAWQEVPWTESFMDIRGPDYPAPYFDTKVKVRWDDERLYVGARMEETEFWGTANYTEDESLVWQENAFEVYAVPDGSLHNYKEMQISVRNVTWDLMLKKAYIDAEQCSNVSPAVSEWSSDMRKATYTDGIVNDPVNGKGTFWSAEWSFSFSALARHTNRAQGSATPSPQEAWFFIFARPEYKGKVVDGVYEKDESVPTEWWSWQPMYTVNLHLPSRFGLVQFKRELSDKTFGYNKWHLYRALFEVFEAEHRYKAVNGMYIDDLSYLDVAPKILASNCAVVTIELTSDGNDFQVNAKSNINPNLQTGHIRADRYVWFT